MLFVVVSSLFCTLQQRITLCLLKDSCHSLNNESACHYIQVASPRLNEERKTNDEKYFVIIIQ